MRLAHVILSYGTSHQHAELVAQVLDQGADPDDVLVVHNPDGTPEGVRPPPIDGVRALVMDRNLGYGAAMNAGLAHWLSEGADWVLLLTHDARLRAGALDALRAGAASPERYGVLGAVLVSSRDGAPYSFGGVDHPRNITEHLRARPAAGPDGVAACDWVDGTVMMLRAEAVSAAGPLDGGFFMYFEEADFCLRARRAGWRVGTVLAAEAATAPGQTRRPLAFGYLFARNGLRYARRAGGREGLRAALRSQLAMAWWLAAKPWERRFYRPAELRFGYVKALGLVLGVAGAALGQSGPPPRPVRRLSDIRGTAT